MTARHLCVSCWRRVAPADLWFRCPSCRDDRGAGPSWLAERRARLPAGEAHEPGFQPVATMRRSWRRWFGDDSRGLRCARHPSADLDLACVCGHPLPSRARPRGGKPVALGVAGPRGSGKTLFLIAALRALRGLVVDDRTFGILGVDGTEERFASLAGPFLQEGLRPDATMPEPGLDGGVVSAGNLCWELHAEGTSSEAGRRRNVPPRLLTAFDVAGESWTAPSSSSAPRLDRYLELVGTLVFLIDSSVVAADLGLDGHDAWDPAPASGDGGAADLGLMSTLIDRLGPRTRRIDLALVVSKADRLWADPDWASLDGPVEADRLSSLLSASGRQDLLTVGRGHFRSIGGFACSSLGFRPSDTDVDGERLTRPIAPVGVAAPITWALDRHRTGAR